jgi:hypothetical protein
MNRTLVRKELRELLPYCVLSLVMGFAGITGELAKQVDMRPLQVTFDQLEGTGPFVFWILGFAIGTGLTTREQEDGTLAFLDGLPVGRSTIFFTKCAVMIAIVLLAPVVNALSIVAMHLLSRGSLDHDLHAPILLTVFGVQLLSTCGAVLLGAALGRLRSLTWMVTGALASGLALLVDHYPRARALNPSALLDIELDSAGATLDAEAAYVQAALALVAFVVAWQGFVHAGKSRLPALSRRPLIGALISVLTAGTLIASLALWTNRDKHDADDEEHESTHAAPKAHFAPSPPAQTATAHYRISYPAHQARAALALAADADSVFERVHELLGAPSGELIDVDASGSMNNTEGTAYFGRIRMQLESNATTVLAHETSHVVAQRLAGKERDWLWRAANLLDEGLATWVERHFEDGVPERGDATDRLLLAALHTRRELNIEELVDPPRLAQIRDDHLKYPAGAAVIAAMVKLHGEAALPRLLHAFGDDNLPTDLHGLTLWQAVFQHAGMDLASVFDEMYREVAEDAAGRAPEIAALPRPRVRLVRDDDAIGAQALLDRERQSPGRHAIVLRFKPERDSGFETFESYTRADGQVVWRDDAEIVGAVVCVQAGLKLAPGRVLYEAWTCLPTRDADPWQPVDAGADVADAPDAASPQ